MRIRIGALPAAMASAVIVAGAVAGPACRTREVPPLSESQAPARVVEDVALRLIGADGRSRRVSFEYADLSGRFLLAARRAMVPPASRRVVRVIGPTVKPDGSGDDPLVHVVDLSRVPEAGYVTALIPARRYRRRALAALPPGVASRLPWPLPGAADATADAVGESREPAGASSRAAIVYGTAWSGPTARAAAFLAERGVPAQVRDVERDPGAARTLAATAASLGVIVDRVPVIDLGGDVVVGFDPPRLQTLIGDRI
jgi:hypothetical protein